MMPTTFHPLAINAARAALCIVDVQDRLAAAMKDKVCQQVERNVAILCDTARRFAIPVVVSEQYPKGLGSTTGPVAEALAELGDLVYRIEKTEFSVCMNEGFAPIWDKLERDHWIVTGMECHVCVYQSVRQMIEQGVRVHVPSDAVCSRSKRNWKVGLGLIERAGGVVTSTEAVVFDILQKAEGDNFKALSKRLR